MCHVTRDLFYKIYSISYSCGVKKHTYDSFWVSSFLGSYTTVCFESLCIVVMQTFYFSFYMCGFIGTLDFVFSGDTYKE